MKDDPLANLDPREMVKYVSLKHNDLNQHKMVTQSTHKFTAEDLHNLALANTISTKMNPDSDGEDLSDDDNDNRQEAKMRATLSNL